MARVLVGLVVWSVDEYGSQKFISGPFRVTGFKQFLPAEMTNQGERKKSLVQIFTDFGLRTLAVAQIWAHDPARSDQPW